MRYALIKAVLVALLAVFPDFSNALAEQQGELSWPGDTWEVSSPEAEGLDAGAIGQLDDWERSYPQ